MKFSVQWTAEKPTTAEAEAILLESGGSGLSVTSSTVPVNMLGNGCLCHTVYFECVSLKCFPDVPWSEKSNPRHNGLFVGKQILKWLERNHQVHGIILVEGVCIEEYTAILERRVVYLEGVIGRVVPILKKFRSWFPNRELAQARRDLEVTLARPRE